MNTIKNHFITTRIAELMENYGFTYAMAKNKAEEEWHKNDTLRTRHRDDEYEEEINNV